LDESQRRQMRAHLDKLAQYPSIGVKFLDQTRQSAESQT
jgi:hypothetical protein